MNTLKKFICGAFVVALAFGLQAGTLYWQINNNPNNDQYAALVIKNTEKGTSTYATLLNGPGGTAVGYLVAAETAMEAVQYADVTGYSDSAYIFYIEMLSVVDGAWQQGWTSSGMSYSQLSNYISEGGITAGSVSTWSANIAIPEPTSGLLLLIGGSLLALRRRRRA